MDDNQPTKRQLEWLWNMLERNGYDPDAMAEIQCKKDFADLTKNDFEHLLALISGGYKESNFCYT